MAKKKEKTEFVLKSILLRGVVDGVEELELQTNAGLLLARFHPVEQRHRRYCMGGRRGGSY